MPYIDAKARSHLRDQIREPNTVGELTFVLYEACLNYLSIRGESYQVHADIVAALENCKEEYRRQIINPYEDEKIQQNGDIFLP